MNVFRWIIGVMAAVMAIGMLISFGIHIASNNAVWLERARRFRHYVWLAFLFWFNVEVWGKVILTIVHWKR